jgi:hypothetical protein
MEAAMDPFAPSERTMWDREPKAPRSKASDEEINAKYTSREWRIVTESNREQLPNFVDALKRHGWMDLRPFYQRRPRWDSVRQSKLIESFIMNIPVPPLFVYEADLARYEVMDGQQRISAIRDFYSNNLVLGGLEQWPELNGRTYSKLPSEIRKGIDRRSISYIVLLKESAETSEEQMLLRQLVFERLNTGGVVLSQQEVRNCLYQGPFNTLLFALAANPHFRRAWQLPPHSPSEDATPPEELLENPFYAKMTDVEMVLRFFALRHATHYQRGMQGFLDLYMVRARRFAEADLQHLRELFEATIELGSSVFGEVLFRPWQQKEDQWASAVQRAFADAVMVGFSRNLQHSSVLANRKQDVIEATKRLFEAHPPGTFTGRGNSKADVSERINLFSEMLREVATA